MVCPPGTVTAFPAFAACVPCHAGGYANAQGTLCLACEDGISASGSTKCEAPRRLRFTSIDRSAWRYEELRTQGMPYPSQKLYVKVVG